MVEDHHPNLIHLRPEVELHVVHMPPMTSIALGCKDDVKLCYYDFSVKIFPTRGGVSLG